MGDLPRKAVVSIVTMSNYHIKTSYKISKQNNEMLMFVDTSADVAVLWLSWHNKSKILCKIKQIQCMMLKRLHLLPRRWRGRWDGGRRERRSYANETCCVQSRAEPHHRLAGVLHTRVTPGSALTPHPLISLKKSPSFSPPRKSFQPPKNLVIIPWSCKSSPSWL